MKRLLSLLLLLSVFALTSVGQNVGVKGHVYDDQNEPAIGATIRLKSDPKVGTQSSIDGSFTIKAKEGDILIVSYIGYQTIEVKARQNMTIVLKSDAELLSEVVVSGYGSGRAKSNTTASVVKVTAKDLESKPVSNVFDGLQGRVSGLSVASTSGEPGQLADITLHGNGSLGLGSAPMYIVDGMPVAQGTVMGLNPNDFESVQVLKDASATAIYGSRAANGVIFISTKRGANDSKAVITLTTQYGVSNLANRSFYDQMMTADELADFWVKSGIHTADYVKNLRKVFPHDTNWTDYYYRKNAPTINTTLSISGGSKKSTYYVSAQYFSQQGLFAGKSEYTKGNLRANLSATPNDWLSFYLNNAVFYDNTLTSNSGFNAYTDGGLFYTTLPFYTPYKENGEPYYDELIPGLDLYSPDYYADMQTYLNTDMQYMGTAGFSIRPIEGLTLDSRVNINYDSSYYNYQRDPRAKWSRKNGTRTDSFGRGFEITFTNTAEYRFEVGSDHHFIFLLGHEYNRYDGNGATAKGWGLTDHRLMHLDKVTDPQKKDISSYLSQYAYLSFFGRFSYDLMDRYHLDLSLRDDASSKFPPLHRHAIFWSVGLKWNAHKETFLKDVDWVDNLDVKVSSGTAGNSALGNYDYFALAGPADKPYMGEQSRVIVDVGNPDLTWEKQLKSTVGLDFGFLRRFSVNVEFYHRLTTDMVMSVPYPYTSGISSNVKNVGSYRNMGVDFRLDTDLWRGRGGNHVSAYLNLNYNQDKVIELFQGKDTWVLPSYLKVYQVGKPVMYCMPIFKAVDPQTGDPQWYNPGEDKGVMHKDDSDISVGFDYNEEALNQNCGIPINTPCQGGFGLNGRYEGFFASADFSFFLGKHIVNNDLFFSDNPRQFGWNASRRVLDAWKQPGDVSIYPDVKRYSKLIQFDTRMLQDASFLRLKSLNIGYDVPAKYLDFQSFLSGLKISITGRNLLTFTKFIGSDPEPDANLSYGMNPATKQVLGTLEVKF